MAASASPDASLTEELVPPTRRTFSKAVPSIKLVYLQCCK